MMKPGFEDAFMDAQSDVISLCLELLETENKEADKAYVYLYQNENLYFVNAFFAQNGKVIRLNDWFSDEEIGDFFDCLEEDLENIVGVCEEYEADCPHELRLVYDCSRGSLDTEYRYEDISEEEEGLEDIFFGWRRECEKGL